MDVARREKFSSTCRDPPFPRRGLTLRAVPVAAGGVRDGAMPAAGALIEMNAQGGGTTARNCPEDFDMLPNKPVGISFDESSSPRSEEQRPPHGGAGDFIFQLQVIQS